MLSENENQSNKNFPNKILNKDGEPVRYSLNSESISHRSIKAKIKNNKNHNNNFFKKCIIIFAFLILIITITVVMIVFFLKTKRSYKNNEENKDNEGEIDLQIEKKEYFFTAIYQSQKGKKIKLFNPERLGLKDDEYLVHIFSEKNILRKLEEIEINEGKIISNKNGFSKILVSFKKPLSNLDFMFQDCKDLINVDLSNINSPSLNSSIYTFTNCKKLEAVNFTSVNTSNVESMDFLFAGCNNLFELTDFENLNVSSVKQTTGMFSDCTSIRKVNLSSFDMDNVEDQSGMFINNPSLKLVEIHNCSDANKIFSTQSEFNLTIFGNNISDFLNFTNKIWNISILKEHLYGSSGFDEGCYLEKNEHCKECNDESPGNCKSCNDGYYLPDGNLPKWKCQKCDIGCNLCDSINGSDSSYCTSCDEGYKLYDGNCIKNCETGKNEKCKDCKTENGTNDQCLNCNEGYYLDISINTSECQKIQIENCLYIDNITLKCTKCSKGYMLYNDECIKSCDEGENEKCKTCNPSYEFREYCEKCNSGYYRNDEINSKKCQSCSDANIGKNCKECGIISGKIVCLECKEGYVLINNSCFKNCDPNCKNCNFDGINKGRCLECKETYYLKLNSILNESIYLNEYYCSKCPQGCYNCSDYYIDNTPISLNCTTCLPGYYLKNYLCEKQCDVGENNLCLTCNKNIKNRCETCNPGYYLNINVGTCISCEVNYCDKCYQPRNCNKCIDNYEVLNGLCYKTCEKGENEKCFECNNTYLYISENCISCNNGYFLPNDIQNKKKCYPCNIGCIRCSGNLNNSICDLCEDGFSLNNGKCVKSCNLGSGELCKSCDLNNNEQNCLTCNDEYYLPNNEFERKKCKKCGNYMKKCHEYNNKIIPDECYPPYIPSGGYCLEKCKIGSEHYCYSCSEIPEKINQCEKCNVGYYVANDSNKTICHKCNVGCKNCKGSILNNICIECQNDYQLFDGKCIKDCYILDRNEFCATCNSEAGKNDRCKTCNEGYYLPDYSTDLNLNKICKKCPLNCKKCRGTYSNPICEECENENYHLVNNTCFLSCQYYQLNYNCSNCINSVNFPTYSKCISCNPRYYLPKNRQFGENYNKCQKCTMEGCIFCEGDDNYSNICTQCEDGLSPDIDDNGIILSCFSKCEIGKYDKCKSCSNLTEECGECHEGFQLIEGKCVSIYHIYAKYKTTIENENVFLFNSISISKSSIDGKIINEGNINNYIFEKPGEHVVLLNLTNINVFMNLFNSAKNLISIEFSDNFNSSEITFMNGCFSQCNNLEYVDMSKLNLSNNLCFSQLFEENFKLKKVKFPDIEVHNVIWLSYMFYNCESLTTIDLTFIHNDNAEYYDEMFYGCKSLEKLYLPNFNDDGSKKGYFYYTTFDMFIKVPKNATMYIGEPFFNTIKDKLVGYSNVYPF